jgi:DNA polymerase
MLPPELIDFAPRCAGCQKCDLAKTRRNVVVHKGDTFVRVMLVGEAPGADEDATGKPFVGAAGQMLDRMFKSVDIDTADLYITNTIKCRPPNNRPPTDQELDACRPWLEEQIRRANPRFIVAVGNSALKWFTGQPGITRKHGRWFKFQGIPVIAIYHPSYLLRTGHLTADDSPKAQAYRDLQAIAMAFGSEIYEDAKS